MSNSSKANQFTRLEDEEVKIEINVEKNQPNFKLVSNSLVQLIFRSPSNEDSKLLIDNTKIITVLQLRIEYEYTKLDFTNGDVVLYMIFDIPKIEENLSEEDSSSSRENGPSNNEANNSVILNSVGNISHRGFNRFRQFGVSSSEIYVIRMLFHTVFMNQHRGENLNWTPEAVLNREEDWMDNYNAYSANNGESNDYNPSQLGNRRSHLSLYVLRPNSRMSPIRMFNLTNNSDFMRRSLNDYLEPDSRFFAGIIVGLFLNFFGLLFLLFFNLRPKFKLGMQLGILFGVIFCFLLYAQKH